MQNLEQLKTKADQLATEIAANDAANAAEHAAAVELLHKVIAIAKPAIRAVGDKAMDWQNKQGTGYSENRTILIGEGCEKNADWKFSGEYIQIGDGHVIRQDGSTNYKPQKSMVTRRVYGGYGNGGGFTVQSEVYDVDLSAESAATIQEWITEICLKVAAAGSRKGATKAALARAEKLKALAALL